jgi:hypothetical protein
MPIKVPIYIYIYITNSDAYLIDITIEISRNINTRILIYNPRLLNNTMILDIDNNPGLLINNDHYQMT